MHPLIEEAMKKSAICWLDVAGHGRYPVWCLWSEGALCVVSGPGEQPAPGLAQAGTVTVAARGDHGGRIVTWPAQVQPLIPGSPQWQAIAAPLAAKRLNAPDAAAIAARWERECVLCQLVPVGDPVEAGPTLPDGSLAEPPAPTPAARRTAKPFRLHRVRR